MKTCKVEGCDLKYHAKGYCLKHYKVFWRIGKPIPDRPCFHGTHEERFWHYTDKKEKLDCWEWKSNKDKDGYGNMRVGKKMIRAHRFSFELHHRKLKKGELVLHSCNNPSCVNPHHLRAGNQTENMKDRKLAGNEPCGENHHSCKISFEDVLKLREESKKHTAVFLAKKYRISPSQAKNIIHKKQRING